jgi:putative aldouronate transport system permease protein
MKDSLRDRAFGIVSYVFIGVFALLCFLPFWMLISGSFTKESELILNVSVK